MRESGLGLTGKDEPAPQRRVGTKSPSGVESHRRLEPDAPSEERGRIPRAFEAPEPMGVIRVVVVTAGEGADSGPPPMAVETTAALARLGDPVELIRPPEGEELRRAFTDPSIDLVLFDRVGRVQLIEWLSEIEPSGPPSIAVIESDSESDALDAFRAGAADCVRFGSDYENVLPVVLLEQVRRWRGERRKRLAEHRMRWLEDLYAAIVSEMPFGLVVFDADGLIGAENPEFGRLFPGRSPVSEPTSEILEARLPVEILHAVARLEHEGRQHSSETPRISLIHVDDGGSEPRAFEVRYQRLEALGQTLLMVSDVTESEGLSERLDTLRRDTRDIIKNINSALIVVDLAGRITFSNPAADRILGGEGDQLLGRQIEDWFGPATEVPGPIEACLVSGTRSRGAETLLQRGDGHWIPVGVSCSPRLDGEGRSRGAVAVFQDLSEIKELELQVRQTEKMASIGQLAAGVAHEVNNPMGFIHANLHQMSEYLGDLDRYFQASARLQQAALEGDLDVVRAAAEDVAAVSREIDLEYVRSDFEKAVLESAEGAERIRHIVKDLRDFSRPDLPARSPADINQAIDSTANIVRTMMKQSVVIEKEYQDLAEIQAYPMQLKQVFMNLLVNAHQAIEAKPDGDSGVIRIETAQIDDEIVVRISDTGVGISEADQTRIFEPFFSTKPVGAGTGLGLSTSFNIIERHGGQISVESEVGRGTLFEIRLPVSIDRAQGVGAEASELEGRVR